MLLQRLALGCILSRKRIAPRKQRGAFGGLVAYIAVAVEAQGRLVQSAARRYGMSKRNYTPIRGKIQVFSKASRKRLLRLVARFDFRAVDVKFITLTYGQVYPNAQTAKQHLRALLERFRRAHPQASLIWRLEYQQRGAPHFHLLAFNLPFIAKEYLAKVWADIIGDTYWDYSQEWSPKPPFTRIEAVRSGRQAVSYVSKYVAKVGDGSGFNSSTYPHGHSGRWWGVHNRDKLPYAPKVEIIRVLSSSAHWRAWSIWREAADAQYEGSGRLGEIAAGTMLFSDKAYYWLAFLQSLMRDADEAATCGN